MKNLNPAITLTKNSTTGEIFVDYAVFSPGQSLSIKETNQVQVDVFSNQSLPGVRIEIVLEIVGHGNPLSVAGRLLIDSTMTFDENKPYIDMVIYVWDSTTQENVRKGNGIVRHQDMDIEA